MQNFETMTWHEILKASGGRSNGNNNHEIPISDLCSDARKRLEELNLDDTDSIFSLRLAGKQRIFGIKEKRVLKIIWFDPDHSVCPSNK
jgi:hypothetical protein